jgi:hypothetical protein
MLKRFSLIVTLQVLVKLGCLPFSFDNVTRVNVGRTSSVAQVLPLSSLSSLLIGTTNLKHLKLYNTNCVSKRVPSFFELFLL